MSPGKRVIASNRQGRRQSRVDTFRIMFYDGRLAMQYLPGDIDLATKRGDDSLLAHTDAKHWYLAAEIFDCGIADARISLGMTWTGADDQLRWLLCDQLVDGDLVIAIDSDSCAFQHQVLVHVPGKGVIIVDQNEVGSALKLLGLGGMVGRMVDQTGV